LDIFRVWTVIMVITSIQDWNMARDTLIPGELPHRVILLPQYLVNEWLVGVNFELLKIKHYHLSFPLLLD
jgi:hypothetical protein